MIFSGLHSPLHHCDELLGHLLAGEDRERPRDSCQVDQEILKVCNKVSIRMQLFHILATSGQEVEDVDSEHT